MDRLNYLFKQAYYRVKYYRKKQKVKHRIDETNILIDDCRPPFQFPKIPEKEV